MSTEAADACSQPKWDENVIPYIRILSTEHTVMLAYIHFFFWFSVELFSNGFMKNTIGGSLTAPIT